MKYTLKKKFHPNQVEEVGHVFNELESYLEYKNWTSTHSYHMVAPHEIALLIHAGFLERTEEKYEKYNCGTERVSCTPGCKTIHVKKVKAPESEWDGKTPEQKIELWDKTIGMLRQWLNEARITDHKKMVTNEELNHWLKNIKNKFNIE